MIESPEQRIERIQELLEVIVLHDPQDSFLKLIEGNRELFKGLKLIYSTNNIETDFSNYPLKKIEEDCPVLKKFFYGSGLLFYSDELFRRTLIEGKIKIPLDYSLSLDSNAAEKFRVWENGGSLDKDQDRFEELVRFIKEGEDDGFNFDYSFFIIENLLDSMKEENDRPFNTVRALKRFDHLNYDPDDFDIALPRFNEGRDFAGRRAIETLHLFQTSKDVLNLLDRRKSLYIILLKAVILKQNKSTVLSDQLAELVGFTLDTIGKFAKSEIYFAWKFLKYGGDFDFFNPISQLGKKSIKKIRGMSWDLFAFRYQETLASKSYRSDFFVPFFASFDNKFVKLAKACPVRCILTDDRDKRVFTVFLDEYEFHEDLDASMNQELKFKISNPVEKIKRLNMKITSKYLDEKILEIENELTKFF
ncbi:hypothetical protein QCB45_10270 [Thiomicrorhabdus sp. ZW0627]|uniref:hypothetical protein n=1 Tax=Thiomicrorhabdus sp. ZW0627 TaxID=3039774 RepID=UPI002436EB7E|nr:hypothetical protein [Thiomicrorhabdus sp. ZW0627]MDG6774716.1 hypothetical protein [Thiomicrorhabdus sp. ZW0627]